MIDKIKQRLATLGYTVTNDDNDFIEFVLGKIEHRVLIFTNLSVVPDKLEYEIIDAVVSEFMLSKLATNGLDIERAVQSITEGDTSVTFANGSDTTSILKRYYESFALDNAKLVKFRVLTW